MKLNFSFIILMTLLCSCVTTYRISTNEMQWNYVNQSYGGQIWVDNNVVYIEEYYTKRTILLNSETGLVIKIDSGSTYMKRPTSPGSSTRLIPVPDSFFVKDLQIRTKQVEPLLLHSSTDYYLEGRVRKTNKRFRIKLLDPTEQDRDLKVLDLYGVIPVGISKLLIDHANGFDVNSGLMQNKAVGVIDLRKYLE